MTVDGKEDFIGFERELISKATGDLSGMSSDYVLPTQTELLSKESL
jgi:hypothetical protein